MHLAQEPALLYKVHMPAVGGFWVGTRHLCLPWRLVVRCVPVLWVLQLWQGVYRGLPENAASTFCLQSPFLCHNQKMISENAQGQRFFCYCHTCLGWGQPLLSPANSLGKTEQGSASPQWIHPRLSTAWSPFPLPCQTVVCRGCLHVCVAKTLIL